MLDLTRYKNHTGPFIVKQVGDVKVILCRYFDDHNFEPVAKLETPIWSTLTLEEEESNANLLGDSSALLAQLIAERQKNERIGAAIAALSLKIGQLPEAELRKLSAIGLELFNLGVALTPPDETAQTGGV